MENHTTKRAFSIRHNKSIGTVIFVVEGESDEFKLIHKIFHKILHYEVIISKRNSPVIKRYTRYASEKNKSSRIIVINTSSSNVRSLREHDEYRSEIFRKLIEEYKIDPKNAPVYYVWDRDAQSNDKTQVRSLVNNLGSAYDNNYCENGLLLLNYPALEAYNMSCFKTTSKHVLASVKPYKKSPLCSLVFINEGKICLAAKSMHEALCGMGIVQDHSCYDTEHFGCTNCKILKKEEEIYSKQHGYRLLSLLTIALLDLGIMEIN